MFSINSYKIKIAVLAQKVEHFHGKEKVPGSNPGNGLNSKLMFILIDLSEK